MTLPPMEWVERIIRIDTTTHKTNEEIIRFLVPLLDESGLKVMEQEVVENGTSFKNLVAFSHEPDSENLLVFNTHLDTVAAGDPKSWTKTEGDPFRATQVGDRLYGLGSADVKLDFLCKLMAARNAKPWKRPFALVGTFGEERGLVGAQHLLSSGRVKPRFALIGEPSNLELIYAHKGHVIVELAFSLEMENVHFLEKPVTKRWKGKAAHSSTPQLGENALVKALGEIAKRGWGIRSLKAGVSTNAVPDFAEAQIIGRPTLATSELIRLIHDLQKLEKSLQKVRDPRFSPSTNTLSFNLARTEKKEILVTFDIRTLPDTNSDKLRQKVEKVLDRDGCRVVRIDIDRPLKGSKESRLIKAAAGALKACGTKPVLKTKASSTEAALYRHYGAEALVFGPGLSIGNVHRPNEYNSLKQLAVATEFYSTILSLESGEL